MWADTLLAAERAHLLRLVLWGGASTLVGTAVLAWLATRRHRSSLLQWFAIQTAVWGGVELAFAALSWATLATRDLSGATRLDRVLWMNIGLDGGYILVGLTLAILGWRLGRRAGLVGAGMGVVAQGVALLLLDLVLATRISR